MCREYNKSKEKPRLLRASYRSSLYATAVGAVGLHLWADFATGRPRSLSFETIGTGTNPTICTSELKAKTSLEQTS